MVDDDVLTHHEAVRYLGITSAALYGLVRYGTIKPERITVSDDAKKYYNLSPVDQLARMKRLREAHPYKTDISDDAIANAVEMYKNGHGIIRCAKELGIGTGRMRKLIVDAGVEIRKPPRSAEYEHIETASKPKSCKVIKGDTVLRNV